LQKVRFNLEKIGNAIIKVQLCLPAGLCRYDMTQI